MAKDDAMTDQTNEALHHAACWRNSREGDGSCDCGAAERMQPEIDALRAELAAVKARGDGLKVALAQSQFQMRQTFADPDRLKDRLSAIDTFADQLSINDAALAAWEAQESSDD